MESMNQLGLLGYLGESKRANVAELKQRTPAVDEYVAVGRQKASAAAPVTI